MSYKERRQGAKGVAFDTTTDSRKNEQDRLLWQLQHPDQEEGDEDEEGNMTNPSWSGILTSVPRNVLVDPRMVLRHVRKFVEITKVPSSEILLPDSPKPANHLRLVCISDTHSHHGRIQNLPAGDVLIHGGDFSDIGLPKDIDAFAAWLDSEEVKSKFKHKIVIAGNHDLSMDPESYPGTWKRFGHPKQYSSQEQIDKIKKVATYLDHEGVTIDGVNFFGSPYQPWFYDWAFNLQRKGECRAKWDTLPKPTAGAGVAPLGGDKSTATAGGGDSTTASAGNINTNISSSSTNSPVDVLITHGPPLGHGDMVRGGGHAGCIDLLDYVEAFPPKVHIFGHIHEGYGLTRNNKGTTFINASTMNVHYDTNNMNPPIIWDVPIPAAAATAAATATAKE